MDFSDFNGVLFVLIFSLLTLVMTDVVLFSWVVGIVGRDKIVYRMAIWRNTGLVYCCDGYIQDNYFGFVSGVYFCSIQCLILNLI